MNKFDKLLEQSLWDNDAEKVEFLKKKIKLNNTFWITFLGTCALRKNYKDNQKVKAYFTTISNTELNKITDNDNDLMFCIKILTETKQMTDDTAAILLKIISKLSTGVDLDEGVLFKSIKKLMSGKIVGSILPSKQIVEPIRDFKKNKITLNDMIIPYYNFAKSKKIANDFVKLTKPIITKIVNTTTNIVDDNININNSTLKNMAKQTDTKIQSKALKAQIKVLNFFEKDLEVGNKMLRDSTITGIPALSILLNNINTKNDWSNWDKTKKTAILTACSALSSNDIQKYIYKIGEIDDFNNMFDDSTDSFLYILANDIPSDLNEKFVVAIMDCIINTTASRYDAKRLDYKILNILIDKKLNIFEKFALFIDKKIIEDNSERCNIFFNEVQFESSFGGIIANNIKLQNYLFNRLVINENCVSFANKRDLENKLYSELFKNFISNSIDLSKNQIKIFKEAGLYVVIKNDKSTTEKLFNDYFKEKINIEQLLLKLYPKTPSIGVSAFGMYNTHKNTIIKILKKDPNIVNAFLESYYEKYNINPADVYPILNKIDISKIKIPENNLKLIFKSYVKLTTYYPDYSIFTNHIIDKLKDFFDLNSFKSSFLSSCFVAYSHLKVKEDIELFKNFIIYLCNYGNVFSESVVSWTYKLFNAKLPSDTIISIINNAKKGRSINISLQVFMRSFAIKDKKITFTLLRLFRSRLRSQVTTNYMKLLKDALIVMSGNQELKKYVWEFADSFINEDIILRKNKSQMTIKVIDSLFGLYLNKKMTGPMNKKVYDFVIEQLDIKNLSIEDYFKQLDEILYIEKYICPNIKKHNLYKNLLAQKQNEDTKKYLNETDIDFNVPINLDKRISGAFSYLPDTESIENAIKIFNLRLENCSSQINNRDLKYVLLMNENFIDILKTEIGYKRIFELLDSPRSKKLMFKMIVENVKKEQVLKILQNTTFNKGIVPISGSLTPDKAKELFKFNKYKIKFKKVPSIAKIDNHEDVLNDYAKEIEKDLQSIPTVKVQKVERTDEELIDKSINYFKTYHAGKHGDVTIKFLEEFNVELPDDQWKEFRKQMFKENVKGVVKPAFHGTGTISASMILRFGFKVTSMSSARRSEISLSGRMLGDGVYFGKSIDKVIGYLGDTGWQRRYGTIGYIFEMDATLGKIYKNYDSAGLNNADGIRSPEWCVYAHEKQLKILKAYKVESVPTNTIKKLDKSMNENRYNNIFDSILLEAKKEKIKDMISWVFYDGDCIVPSRKGSIIKFVDDVKIKDKNVYIEPHQNGCIIRLINTAGINNTVHIPNQYEFMKKDPKGLYSQFKSLMTGKIS